MKDSIKVNMHSEKGSAGIKLVIALVIIGSIGFAIMNYVPIAYQAEDFKQDMETAVIQGISMPASAGKPTEIIEKKIARAVGSHNLPDDTFIDVKKKGNIVYARVYFAMDVPILPFGIYNYEYIFDHTTTPSGFLTE